MPRRQRDELISPDDKDGVSANQQRLDPPPSQTRKGRFDVTFAGDA